MTVTDTADLPDAERRAVADIVAVPPTTIEDVLDQLNRIVEVTHAWTPGTGRNGVACFSRLYLEITQGVKAAWDRGEFRCGTFILDLDVAFARRYLSALRNWVTGDEPTPGCWQILFTRREEELAGWRFAAAGVNAHVNFDLAFALLDTWTKHENTPLATSAEQYADYDMINQIFYRHMERLSEEFHAPLSETGATSIRERVANIVGDVMVWGTRDLAWNVAERMWQHRHEEGFRTGPTEMLDVVATGLARAVI